MNKYLKIGLTCIALIQPTWSIPADITTCFSPQQNCSKSLIEEIENAKKSIYVQAYSFTNHDIAMALIEAKGRGVDVQVYVDKGRYSEPHSKVSMLTDRDIPVIIQQSRGLAHNKIMIIDDELVITGSFNWTNNALKNEENLNFIKSKELVQIYLYNWKGIVK